MTIVILNERDAVFGDVPRLDNDDCHSRLGRLSPPRKTNHTDSPIFITVPCDKACLCYKSPKSREMVHLRICSKQFSSPVVSEIHKQKKMKSLRNLQIPKERFQTCQDPNTDFGSERKLTDLKHDIDILLKRQKYLLNEINNLAQDRDNHKKRVEEIETRFPHLMGYMGAACPPITLEANGLGFSQEKDKRDILKDQIPIPNLVLYENTEDLDKNNCSHSLGKTSVLFSERKYLIDENKCHTSIMKRRMSMDENKWHTSIIKRRMSMESVNFKAYRGGGEKDSERGENRTISFSSKLKDFKQKSTRSNETDDTLDTHTTSEITCGRKLSGNSNVGYNHDQELLLLDMQERDNNTWFHKNRIETKGIVKLFNKRREKVS